MASSSHGKGRWVAAGAVAIAIGAAAVGLALGDQIKSPDQAVADAAPPAPSLVTVEVERRALSDRIVLRGHIEAEAADEVPAPSVSEGGTSQVVTAMLKSSAEELAEGDVVVEVAGRPLFAFQGAFTAYRDIRGGDRGPDVAQLQESLQRLGHDIAVDGVFGPSTQRALQDRYENAGYEPASGTEDPDGARQGADDAVDEARRAVKDATRKHDKAVKDLEAARERDDGDLEQAEVEVSVTEDALERSREQLARAREEREEVELTAGPSLPQSEVIYLRALPQVISDVTVQVGDILDESVDSILELGANETALVVDVPPASADLVQVGTLALAEDASTGREYRVEVASIGEPDDGLGEEQASGNRVRLLPVDGELPEASERSLKVTIEGASTGEDALVVPVTAIHSAADGSSYVEVSDDGTRKVMVSTGLSAGGFVEVEPDDPDALSAGDLVIVGVERGDAASSGEN